jgi:hypothetical protein
MLDGTWTRAFLGRVLLRTQSAGDWAHGWCRGRKVIRVLGWTAFVVGAAVESVSPAALSAGTIRNTFGDDGLYNNCTVDILALVLDLPPSASAGD